MLLEGLVVVNRHHVTQHVLSMMLVNLLYTFEVCVAQAPYVYVLGTAHVGVMIEGGKDTPHRKIRVHSVAEGSAADIDGFIQVI